MAIITGTTGDDTLVVNPDTNSVEGFDGIDTVALSGNHADYLIYKTNTPGYLVTNKTNLQEVELIGVELIQFNDGLIELPAFSGINEFQVNTYYAYDQSNPSTTALDDGGFVVTWQSSNQDGSEDGIFAQRYDASGDSIGSEFRVNTYYSSTQSNPSTTALDDGGFVVTWQSYGQDGSNYRIFAQRRCRNNYHLDYMTAK